MTFRYEPPGFNGERVPSGGSGPGINSFAHHMLQEFPGTTNLGIYGNRNVRNGRSKSLHAVGRAFDWGWNDRKDAETVFDALTDNDGALAVALGIQAVHDYHIRENNGPKWGSHTARARSWGHGRGIHWSNIGPGDQWFHIEFLQDAANDAALMDRVFRGGFPTHAPDVHATPEPHHDVTTHFDHDHAERGISMLILDLNPGTDRWVAMLLAGTELSHIVNGHHVVVMERGHVPRVTLDEVELDGVLRSVRTTNASPFVPGPSQNEHLHNLWEAAK